ncbi:MAG: phosphotransferase, partial [Steroidobacteraceae bacterium]
MLAGMVDSRRSVSPELAAKIACDEYGLHASVEPLTGERDVNFRLSCDDGRAYVLKIANADEPPGVADLPIAALLHLEQVDRELPCPRVRRSRHGQASIKWQDDTGRSRTAHVLTFLTGKPLRSASRSRAQRAACGRIAARIGRALKSFRHPAAHRQLIWDLRQLPKTRLLLEALPEFPERRLVTEFIESFETRIRPRFISLRQQIIHNDLNDRNILVDTADETVITGIIDYGDMLHTALIADLAVSIAEQTTEISSLEETVDDLVCAYEDVEPLQAPELEILQPLIAARIVMSVVIPTWHRMKNPASSHYA